MPVYPIVSMQELFLRESKFHDHYVAQLRLKGAAEGSSYEEYRATLDFLIKRGTELTAATRGRILAVAWALKDTEFANTLLKRGPMNENNKFGIAEVLKALKLLDSARQLRLIRSQQEIKEGQGAKSKKIGKLRGLANDLEVEGFVAGSVSGALCKFLRKWARQLSAKYLEFSALSMPMGPWKEFADIVHVRKTDFCVSWFLPFVFGEAAPEGTVVGRCANFKSKPVDEQVALLRERELPYTFVRRQLQEGTRPVVLHEQLRDTIVQYEDLSTVIWWWEELDSAYNRTLVSQRLQAGEQLSMSYGKTLERILTLQKLGVPFVKELIAIAETQLSELKAAFQQEKGQQQKSFVIHGDASSSMSVAVNTATIFGSILALLTNGSLRFFNGRPLPAVASPTTVAEVLEVTRNVRASGCTANAATLWESYEKKQKVDFHIQVTDEEENTAYKGYMLADLFKKYREEVHPDSVMIFISFLNNHMSTGQLVRRFEKLDLPVINFKLDGRRPDLTKLQKIISTISMEANGRSVEAPGAAAAGQGEGQTPGAPEPVTPGSPEGLTPGGPDSDLPAVDERLRSLSFIWPRGMHKSVAVAGDWTSPAWVPVPMLPTCDGFFLRQNMLPGRHSYKFIVDGVWTLDPGCEETTDDAGHVNSVV
eukprot:CAMPEP_0114626576 /NCGR_PEP_ID=MMETSP0168-20121206/11853_1 /TAXON_ID=95228 ORGANISM="Vannella sp., Strain DIVA3 517/6/12" /NCGR_SAMPLE_ID=MMETSP0168 /ASSEMBLY_ACC=CAM_ASM_000044 /LENGTH=650 /DNA_ID=CAMNT_0001837885 /DNA_START=31 /DNA_END=1979 /DNA_ORIENTATION=-